MMQDDNSVQGLKDIKDRLRRHHWIPKYEVEFGLQVVERHPHTGEVILAVCGLCKSFGREVREKEDDEASSSPNQRKRRRGLTTTKYFRSFRVDNIRSHLSGAHPVRWQEYQVLAKNEDLRRNYLAQCNVNMGLMTSLPMNMMGLPGGMDDGGDLDSDTHLAMNAIVQQSTRQSTPNKRPASSIPGSFSGNRPPPLDPKTIELQKYQLDWERLEFERMRFHKELHMKELEEKQNERKLRHEKEMREKDRELDLEKAKIEQEKFNKLVDCLNRALGHVPVSSNVVADSIV
ncbi:hypothetical protein DYB25_011870 [Aphanomyces astaci]|uniref:Uncharacterized protein n=1 Tax=Aphanomyces astaci TaxID=112090 RepID=A0A397CML8_APHAT|nr:hypothetical protein DYB36_004000 [Aphanomyces astaci]RHY21021.1 hypothetical protein DYB25_011870 [Aphanomyces astaci]RHY46050.1 hypothetical protein DYB30_012506 [Aphanomyces astaci]RHZ31642.1 hypothetical protein DYB26_006439 [Aphanomyces astaci]